MSKFVKHLLEQLSDRQIGFEHIGIKRGVEKESLRVSLQGEISQNLHPSALGSALTHESITTDYSEALLEFITPVFSEVDQTLSYLYDLHNFVYQSIGDELLWASSMPCLVKDELSIPIAQYGSSNIGQLKHIYRHGLWHRYGRIMQTISGIHYNYSLNDEFISTLQHLRHHDSLSLQEVRSTYYFDMIRNFRRFSWLLMYLFGASPALCSCFLQGKTHAELVEFDKNSLYLPYGTSLRMSDLGYQNTAQADLKIAYSNVINYTKTLEVAINTPYAEYKKMGVEQAGHYKQLNANLLQIENEYYSDIRPKRVSRSGQKPIQALRENGVEYLEVRILDVNPFLPVGIDADQVRFMDVFLLYCLMQPSQDILDQEYAWIRENHQRSIFQGRDPNLKLLKEGKDKPLREWASEIFDDLKLIAQTLERKDDESDTHNSYLEAVLKQERKLKDDRLTPSSLILQSMKQHNLSYFEFSRLQSERHKARFHSSAIHPKTLAMFKEASIRSLKAQKKIEETDDIPFSEFLTNYLSQS